MRKVFIIFFSASAAVAGTFFGGVHLLKMTNTSATVSSNAITNAASASSSVCLVSAAPDTTPAIITTTTTTDIKPKPDPAPTPAPTHSLPPPQIIYVPIPIMVPPPAPAPTPTSSTSTDIAVATSSISFPSSTPSSTSISTAAIATITAASTTPATTPAGRTLPYSVGIFGDGFQNGDGWGTWWGDTAETNGALTVAAPSSGNGAGALLAGSSAWTDYTFTATLDWVKGESFGLVARSFDANNYVVCEFSEKTPGDVYVSLQQYKSGQATELANGDVLNYNQLGGANIDAAIQVQGNTAACAFNNHSISTALANSALVDAPAQGGIGFTVWDPTAGNSEIDVKTVGVTTDIYDLGPNIEAK